ncbi:MAG TPA: OsmC family peroxiredoxin [Micropruina sp.]|nr:OsmC family peroxiredoxin [Micropruina sp.]
MATTSTAQTHWEGGLKEGSGQVELVTSGAGTFDVNWAKRADAGKGTTNPEELLGAAHATCYSMALSLALANNGTPPDSIDTKAEVGFQPGVGVTGSTLTVVGKVPGLSQEEFHRFAEEAKDNCPISAALSIPITLNATFEA